VSGGAERAIALRAICATLTNSGVTDGFVGLQLHAWFVDKEVVMDTTTLQRSRYDDPRKLRDLISKARGLATDYDLTSVIVGVSGDEGDLLFPEMVDFVASALRMDDAIFRMTRERAVFLLADADCKRAETIIERLLLDFREKFTPAHEQSVNLAYFEVTPKMTSLTVRDVLPSLFTPGSGPVAH